MAEKTASAEASYHTVFASEDGIAAGFSLASLGTMSLHGQKAHIGIENRKMFFENRGIDYRMLVCPCQKHTDRLAVITTGHSGRGALSFDDGLVETDGLITNELRLPLAVFTADCLPVFFYHRAARVCAIVHAGWRGTGQRIVEKAVSLILKTFNAGPDGLSVWFGPSIRKCCYRVGEEFFLNFPGHVFRKNAGFFFDLAAANREQLLSSGVREESIVDSKLCTFCGNDFFSYRRDPDCGRMMSFIMLK